jgi:GntR family transcriptional regulator, transcriptional repressor for pyruvate dehydrogenase complex
VPVQKIADGGRHVEKTIPLTYTPVRRQTVVGQVMEQIKELIASGRLKPGDKIPTEQELAVKFGVGRSSIREAIKVFTYLGIFESQTRKGTCLQDHSGISEEALTWAFILGRDDFRNLMEVRKALELEAWFILCEAAKEDPRSIDPTVVSLEKEIRCMKTAIAEKDDAELVEADFRFHRCAVAASGNSLFSNLFDTLKSFTCEEITRSNIPRNYSPRIVEEHREMIEALKTGDLLTITRLFRVHIEKAIGRVLRENG